MKKGLRSRLAQYGDEEFAFFLRRGFLKGAGFTDEALDLPIVGILSTASDFNPCHKTAPQVAEAISRGVRMAGALPFVFPTVSLHEAFSYPTSMLLRNLMAMDVEEMIKALPLDAVVLIGGCDKTIPAELMGAISADMPAIVVNVGSMLAGKHEGARLGACTDCRRLWAQFRAGTLEGDDLNRAHDQLMPTSGTCMVMGTASTMAVMAETLGFMLPGSATAPAVSSDRWRFAEATGRRAAEMAKTGGPKPSELLTKAALKNASVVLQATSGSTNAIVHLAAIAGRAGITYDLQELDQVGREVPVLLDLKPAGMNFMEDFHSGGSLPSLWRRLKDHLDLSATLNHRASPVTRASSCCCPMSCTPTGIPPTLISGTVTTGANSIDDGALNTKSPVGRGASGWPATSPDQSGAGPGQERVIAASASDAAAACASCACWRANRLVR